MPYYDMALNMEHRTWLMTAEKDIIIIFLFLFLSLCYVALRKEIIKINVPNIMCCHINDKTRP